MNAWIVRGVVLAALHVVVRSVLGFAISDWPLHGGLLRWLFLAVVIVLALLWGLFDGRHDRRANPDPERGTDLTIRWLKAALLGGILAGIAAYIVDKLPKFDLGDNSLIFELTSGAAWTVLLIFISAIAGVGIGRLLAGRGTASKSTPSHSRTPVTAGAPTSYDANGFDDAPTETFDAVDPNLNR